MSTEDVTGGGLRERKKKATRGRICQAVLDLTARRSLDQVTVDEIAQHADVSPRTFFNYFQSKEEALLATKMSWVLEVERLLLAAPDDPPPWRALESALLECAAGIQDQVDRQVVRRIMGMDKASVGQEDMRAFVELEKRLVGDIARRMAVDPARDVRPALLVGAGVTALRVALDVWSTIEPEVPLVELTRRCLRHLSDGLGADPVPDAAGALAMPAD